jgi:hypothetical protein
MNGMLNAASSVLRWTLQEFERTLVAELADLDGTFPERVHSFLPDGTDQANPINGLDSGNALGVTAGGIPATIGAVRCPSGPGARGDSERTDRLQDYS